MQLLRALLTVMIITWLNEDDTFKNFNTATKRVKKLS